MNPDWQNSNLQYGDWMRAGGATKGGADKTKPFNSRNHDSVEGENTRGKSLLEPELFHVSVRNGRDGTETERWSQNLGMIDVGMSDLPIADLLAGWDNRGKSDQVSRQRNEL